VRRYPAGPPPLQSENRKLAGIRVVKQDTHAVTPMAGHAAETIVLVSAEKLNAASAFAIGDLSLASTLVTECAPDATLSRALHQQGVTII